jgi:hypothetical protein
MFEEIIHIVAFLLFILEAKTVVNYLKEKWFTFIDLNDNYLNRLIAFIILVCSLMLILFLLFVSITVATKWIDDL